MQTKRKNDIEVGAYIMVSHNVLLENDPEEQQSPLSSPMAREFRDYRFDNKATRVDVDMGVVKSINEDSFVIDTVREVRASGPIFDTVKEINFDDVINTVR